MFAEKGKLFPSPEKDQPPVNSAAPEVERAIDREPDSPATPPPVAGVESIERADLICKVISERQYYLQQLLELKNSEGMHSGEPLSARVDLQIRYSSALKKDLWRAILQFHDLKSPL